MSSVLKCAVSGPKMASNTVTNLATNFLSFVLVVKSWLGHFVNENQTLFPYMLAKACD